MTVTKSIPPSFPQVGGMSQAARKTKQQAGTCKDYTLIMWKLDTATGATAVCSDSIHCTTVQALRVCVCVQTYCQLSLVFLSEPDQLKSKQPHLRFL